MIVNIAEKDVQWYSTEHFKEFITCIVITVCTSDLFFGIITSSAMLAGVLACSLAAVALRPAVADAAGGGGRVGPPRDQRIGRRV